MKVLDVRQAWLPELDRRPVSDPSSAERAAPVWIALLGGFRLTKLGQPIALRPGGKPELLLSALAVRTVDGMRREQLLEALWPDGDPALAMQSLNNLVYTIHKLLGDVLGGSALILHRAGRYILNTDAGIGIDVVRFEELASIGDRYRHNREDAPAAAVYAQAVGLYRGDLYDHGSDVRVTIERERLRARYLTLLTRLAHDAFCRQDYETSLDWLERLLQTDPCREDAHRQAMRCLVRLGERGRALRQFRVCESVLREEFDAVPEPATLALFDRVRLDPASI